MRRILILDDDPVTCDLLSRILETEYQVAVCHDAQDGLRLARQFFPDLILLDILMPGMDGFAACREIRRTFVDVPIVFISGLTETPLIVRALEMGGDGYITKPFEPQELLARLRAILRRVPAGPLNGVGFRLDTETRFLSFADGRPPVRLTPTEQHILLYLLRHPEQTVSARQLIKAVWNPPEAISATLRAALRRHIHGLRRKIEPNHRTPRFIVRRPGGYRLQTDALRPGNA